MTSDFLVLSLRSAWHYRRTHMGTLLGVVVASAVLVGALLVGDSVTYSLRRLALLRLGGTEYAVDAGARFFDERISSETASALRASCAAVLQLDGMALHRDPATGAERRANRVRVLGIDASFPALAPGGGAAPRRGQIALSRKLALQLGASTGDEVALRVEQPSLLPRDAPLSSRKDRLYRRAALTVSAVVGDEALGRFSLRAEQVAPFNAFVDLAWLQETVGLGRGVNLLLVAASGDGPLTTEAVAGALKRSIRPGRIGLEVREATGTGVLQLESGRVFLDPAVTQAALSYGEGEAVGALTYLVNSISLVGTTSPHAVPYSFMLAASPSADRRLSPVPAAMAPDEILLNRWTADRLGAATGDRVRVDYYELTAANTFEARSREFRVRGVLEMAELGAERELAPAFPGLSDVESCRDWDIGMPLEQGQLADEANEEYWNLHGQTPKAVVSLAAGQAMWGNRFGDLTSVRYPAATGRRARIEAWIGEQLDPAAVGLAVAPVRRRALEAARGAVDFGQLFLGMSFFLIVAALMLTGLLFVFGVDRRAQEIGTLRAVGYRPRTIGILLLGEGAAIALAGCVIGAGLGALYTRALTWGLARFWSGAVSGAAIRFHARTGTLLVGAGASFVTALSALALAVQRQVRCTARELLTRESPESPGHSGRDGRRTRALDVVFALGALAALAMAVAAAVTDTQRAVGVFFGAGALILAAGLRLGHRVLGRLARQSSESWVGLRQVALRNAGRRRGRSLTALGLLACGCFIVFSVSSMKEDAGAHTERRSSGAGGFDLYAESTLGLSGNLADPGTQERWGLRDGFAAHGVATVCLRASDGDDASCFNLNLAGAPRLLGVDPDALSERGAFLDGSGDVWQLLRRELPDGVVPGLAGDADTATWGLKKRTGEERGGLLTYVSERGETFRVKLVGKLPMRLSVFQGTVLIAERDFTRRFPSRSGHRVFLFDVGDGAVDAVAALLVRKLERMGFSTQTTSERLAEFYAVESTYLSMFLVLGGLGLLLGTLGLGVVVLRNIVERRRELAILRAVGFSRAQVRAMVLTEHALLVLMGVGLGCAAAFVAIWPGLRAPGVEVPCLLLAGLLFGVCGLGLLWVVLAARWALRRPLIPALRGE